MSKAKRYIPTDKKKSIFKRGNFFYLFLVPIFLSIILSLIQKNISAFIINIVSFILFFITAKLNSIGLNNEYEYNIKNLTKAPKIPYKTLSAILLGISTLFTAYFGGDENILNSLFLGLVSTVGYFLYYGTDPRKNKLDSIEDISAEFVLKTLSESRAKLSNIKSDMQNIKDTKLYKLLDIAIQKAHDILNSIEDDPKDLRLARKFIIVYIDGIKKVTKSYLELGEDEIDKERKERLYRLLSNVEKKFDEELIKLKKNNQFKFDVQIDLLHQQLK